MTTTIKQSLSERYRPVSIDQLVLAPFTAEKLSCFRDYLANPCPKAWLLHGDTGLGKTSLARIAIEHFREKHRAHIVEQAGPRVRDEMVADWERTFCGDRWFTSEPTVIYVDEADGMTKKAKFGLRTVIEASAKNNTHWIFTSNEGPAKFGRALKGRFQTIPFSDQGVAPRLANHLIWISQQEGHLISEKEAMAIVRGSRNDIRAAMNELDAILSADRFRRNSNGSLAVAPAVLSDQIPSDLCQV